MIGGETSQMDNLEMLDYFLKDIKNKYEKD